jgi:riboflavin transporter FmnP
MSSKNIHKMVVTALLVALAIVFQQLRFVLGDSIITTYLISSLVNLCLIIAATAVGLWSGIAVAVITPLIAFVQGHLPLAQMIPWICAGNAVLVLFYALFAIKDKTSLTVSWPRWAVTGVVAALVKFAVIAFGQTTVITSMKGLAFSAALSTAASAQVVQLVTAGVALILGGLILPMLPKKVVGKTV